MLLLSTLKSIDIHIDKYILDALQNKESLRIYRDLIQTKESLCTYRDLIQNMESLRTYRDLFKCSALSSVVPFLQCVEDTFIDAICDILISCC